MIFKFTAEDGTLIQIVVENDGEDENWETILSSYSREFEYEMELGEDYYVGDGIRGDDALWIPYNNERGLKIIGENSRYQSLQDSLDVVKKIQSQNLPSFPKIEDVLGKECNCR